MKGKIVLLVTFLVTTLLLSVLLMGLHEVSEAQGGMFFRGRVAVDGIADEIQLRVQGYTTQTVNTLVVEQSDGTDVFEVDDNGHITATAFTLDSVALSGPVTFGEDTNTTFGELIAHGLGTTPTVVMLTPISNTLNSSFVVVVTTTNAISFGVGITPTTASGQIGIYWMAGK